ncbi:hypothetical protein L211DRAFT_453407 [Terfezia boudieri ATCC MYA-4762]|uniref:Fungal-type protein kinase domain-containing protein n=1 Tax=Terfezia boudieri ATCC MYA-4762 TaxID=1051890 RepID=A0A3N4LHE8_9PEZI|nr:hypothetical protein L211DRAFT_453407 [Terfezia boudieri ATCC MYA-4762]
MASSMTSPSSADVLRILPPNSLAAYRAITRQNLELPDLRPPLTTVCQQFLFSCILVLQKYNFPQSIFSRVTSLYSSLNNRETEELCHIIISDTDNDERVWDLIFSLVETKSNLQSVVPSIRESTPRTTLSSPCWPCITYKSKSSSMSSSCNQMRDELNPLLQSELEGSIWKDIAFDRLFEDAGGSGNASQIDMHAIMASNTFDEWMSMAKDTDITAFERHGAIWFRQFSERCNVADRFYYNSGSAHMSDAYHGARRRLDICLSRKLAEPSHSLAINGSEATHSWKDVLVLGELKSNQNQDLSKRLILQVARYGRETFGAQPGRRFVHAFTVCGHLARFWFFDRVGVSISECYDISTETGQKSFMHGLLGYMEMTASQLGFDECYKDNSGTTFLPSVGSENNHPAYLHFGDKKFRLLKILCWSPAIITRGTLCWLAKECDSRSSICADNNCSTCTECVAKMCVVKEAWRDTQLTSESTLWQVAKEKEVLGCLDIIVAGDTDVVARNSRVENNVRKYFDYTEATLVEWKILPEETGEMGRRKRKSGAAIMQTIHSEDEREERPKPVPILNESRKRAGSQLESSRPSKTNKPKDSEVVQARARSFMVVRNVGKPLNSGIRPLNLAETLRDAINCHRSLYEKAGILHCDVSIYNIMRMRSTSGLKGFLIDLDYAHQLSNSQEQSLCITGTAPFMALELLQTPGTPTCHTWRHDLESFFYVLIWLCIMNPYKTLNSWVQCLASPLCASIKKDDVTWAFEERVLDNFHDAMNPLKKLAFGLREILFYKQMDPRELEELDAKGLTRKIQLGTPAGDGARCNMYDRIITAFNDCIATLAGSEGEENSSDG